MSAKEDKLTRRAIYLRLSEQYPADNSETRSRLALFLVKGTGHDVHKYSVVIGDSLASVAPLTFPPLMSFASAN